MHKLGQQPLTLPILEALPGRNLGLIKIAKTEHDLPVGTNRLQLGTCILLTLPYTRFRLITPVLKLTSLAQRYTPPRNVSNHRNME